MSPIWYSSHRRIALLIVVMVFSAMVGSCQPGRSEAPDSDTSSPYPESQPITTLTTAPEHPGGREIIVINPDDLGPGTLRQVLEDAQDYDTISFDPAVFPPAAPVTIFVSSELPHIRANNLTIDASNAGVILDGDQVAGGWVAGLQIVSAEGVTVRGLQFTHFHNAIAVSGTSTYTVIGGERSIGVGPTGQGNLFIKNINAIDLSTNGTSHNTITGNLIGTNAEGKESLGNDGDGIVVWEGAHDNTIGPDNIIAFNGGAGVVVRHAASVSNTITQNSIHSNYLQDISLMGSSNAYLSAPLIIAFDLEDGTVTGLTCPNCIVELFSAQGDAGEIFEGQTTAYESGEFTFTKGDAFTGPNLTATGTDDDGNTSQFSRSTWGPAGEQLLQSGNSFPITQLLTKPSGELSDNRIGAQLTQLTYGDESDLWVYPIGVKRARVTITGIEPELVDWGKPELSIDPSYDGLISRLTDNGIRVTYTLMFWDKKTYPNGEGAPCARFKTKEEIERWLDYVRFTVAHFQEQIQYYEIWNEPDIREYCPKWIEIEDYINLVRQTVPAIKDVYPEARVVVGAISNTRFEQDYLFQLLESEIMPLVDGISWHPMYSPSPEYEIYEEYYYTYPDFVQQIKDTALDNKFTGEFQADEIGWATKGHSVADQPWEYTPTAADKYWGRGIIQNLGLDVNVGLGENNAVAQNLCTVMAGAAPIDLEVDVRNSDPTTLGYAFSLEEGGYLVGLWTNGIATEYDPGVDSTVTIQGVLADKVVAVDSLYGFEQELNFETQNGNLVINNLMVKDYPIILRLFP
jgi:hypothetical protein